MKQYIISLLITLFLPAYACYSQVLMDSTISYRKPLFDYEESKPVFDLQKSKLTNSRRLLRYYVITGYREGVEPISGQLVNLKVIDDTLHHTQKWMWVNCSIVELLRWSSGWGKDVILEVKEPYKFRYTSNQGNKLEWLRKYARCLEFMVPDRAMDTKNLRKDCADLFDVTFNEETRNTDVFVLRRLTLSADDESKAQAPIYSSTVMMSKLVEFISEELDTSILNETSMDVINIDLEKEQWKNMDAIKNTLARAGLELIKEKRLRTVFVIKDKEKQNEN